MPSDKADNIETNYLNLPTLRLFDEQKSDGQKNEVFARKYDNVFPLDRRNGEEEPAEDTLYEKTRNGYAVENQDSETGVLEQRERAKMELKTRTEALLTKIKSGTSGANPFNAVDHEPDDEAELKTNTPAHSQSTERGWPPSEYKPPQSFSEARDGGPSESASGESERLRAEIIAKAREAETRAREAEEKFRQSEIKLKQEATLRLLAEQRVKEIEEEYSRRLTETQAGDLSRLEAEMARAEAEARVKQEAETRAMVEKKLAQTKAEALSTSYALEDAERKLAMADSRVRTAEERAKRAEEAVREAEALIREADALAREYEEKYKALEAGLQNEIELRTLAEQKALSIEEDFKRDLEADWSKFEADIVKAEAAIKAREESIARTSAEQARLETIELTQQLTTGIEAERQARIEAEQARDEAEAKLATAVTNAIAEVERNLAEAEARAAAIAAESERKLNEARAQAAAAIQEAKRKVAETEAKAEKAANAKAERKLAEAEAKAAAEAMVNATETEYKLSEAEARAHNAESKLRETEEKLHRAEASLKKLLRKPGSTSSDQLAQTAASSQSLMTLRQAEEVTALTVVEPVLLKTKIKLVSYGVAITLLLVALVLLGLTAIRLL
jgi:hypothetical protein